MLLSKEKDEEEEAANILDVEIVVVGDVLVGTVIGEEELIGMDGGGSVGEDDSATTDGGVEKTGGDDTGTAIGNVELLSTGTGGGDGVGRAFMVTAMVCTSEELDNDVGNCAIGCTEEVVGVPGGVVRVSGDGLGVS